MSAPHDEYQRWTGVVGELLPCPVCGHSKPSVWSFTAPESCVSSRVVMCEHGDTFGPQEAIVNAGCLLYMPPQEFYKATAREAARFWNEYAKALTALQRNNRWKTAKVLRTEEPTSVRENAQPPVQPHDQDLKLNPTGEPKQ